MGIRILCRLVLALGLLPGVASAQLGEFLGDFDRSGFYIGVGGVYLQNSLIEEQLSDVLPVGIEVDDSWGLNAQLGYRAFSFLAAEVEYEYVNDYDVAASGIGTFASLEGHLLTGNLKWIVLPVWRVQPYLQAGVGFVRWEIEDQGGFGVGEKGTDLAGRVGAGADVHLTSRLSLNVGADLVLTDTSLSSTSIPGSEDVDFLGYASIGAGLQYRFWSLTGR